MMKSKHVPQRTCIACRQIREKRNLIRLVRGPDGTVSVDISARKPGRGAYLCSKKDCWKIVLRKGEIGLINRLEHALRAKLRNNSLQILIEYGNNLTEEN